MEQLNLRYTINSDGSITASWDSISNAVEYSAFMYAEKGGVIYYEKNLTVTSYTSRPNLEANMIYKLVVVAYGPSTSLTSDGARILIPSDFYNNIPLDIPQNITAAASPVSVDISFDKVVRASGYDILLNGTIYSITSNLGRITKTISGLTPKTRYSYAVRAKNYYRTGEYSAEQTFTTPAVSPAAPTGITKSVTQNSVTISWNPVQTATMYDIVFNGTKYTIGATSRTFTGLYPGTSYPFKIRGVNSDADGIYTHEMTATTAPQVPTGISAVSTDTTLTISWNAMQGATSYFVYFRDQEIAVPGTDTSTTFTNLTPNTPYTYKVCASSADGRSPYSSEMTTKTTPPGPSMPEEATQTSTENSVTLNWNAVNGADSYDVIFDGQTYHVTRNTITINSLAPNTSYTYRVRANNANGSSEYGPAKTVKTAPTAPAAPNESATKNSITISWSAVPGAVSYDILFNGTTYRVTGTSRTIEGLSAGQSYSYQIRANNADGSSSYSAPKTVSTIPDAPGRPGDVSARAATESITITWVALPRAESYDVLLGNTIYETTGTTITISGLNPYTEYTYQVRAKNAGGAGSYSVAGNIRTLMKAPDNITATATKNSVTLSWSASLGATSYDVLFNGKTTFGIKTTSYTVTGLAKGTAYSYSICAKNSSTSSAYSPTATVMTIPDPPEMPANVRAGAAANSVTISWSAAARAAGYDVYIGGKVYDATGTETTITGLSSNCSYTYQVRAKNAGGTSAYTVSQRITTMLAIPQIINLTVNMYSITAKWISVSGANRYEVLFNGTASIIYGTSKTFLDLTPGTNYTFAIRALSASNSSEYSEMQTLRTIPTAPTTPTNIKATATSESATVTWNAVSGADRYEVLFNNKTYSTETPSVTITGLTANTSYTYRVCAKNAGGTSSYSASQTIKTLEKVPETPVNVRATSTSYTVTVMWNSTTWASSYDVLIGGSTYNTTGTYFTKSGLSAESSYTYQVRAKNSAGTSAYSQAQTIKTLVAPPAVPSNVTAASTTNSVTISWSGVSRADSYEISFNGGTYRVTTGTSKTFTGLEMGTNYTYAVRARNAGGASAYSASKTIQTVPTVPPVPLNVSASAKDDSVTVSWKRVGGAASYDVLFNDTVYNVTSTSRTITALQADTVYSYAVRAKNSVGISSYSSTKTVRTLLPIPENIQAIATSEMVLLSWDEVAGASGYDIVFDGSTYETNNTYKEFTEVNPDTEYTFSVRARNSFVASEYSSERKIRTMIPVPQVPQNIETIPTTNSVAISWDAVNYAAGYDILFNNVVYDVSDTSKTITGLEANTDYEYAIRAKNAIGTSAYSNTKTVRTLLSVPENIQAESTSDTVLLMWDEVNGAEGYNINFDGSVYEVNSTTKEFSGLIPETEYAFSVQAKNAIVTSEYSPIQKICTKIQVPKVPENVTATSTLTSVTVSWDVADDAEAYEIQFDGKNIPVTEESQKLRAAKSLSQPTRQQSARMAKTFFGLKPDTEHTYCVRAGNQGGFSEYSPLGTIRTCSSAESTLPAGKFNKTYPAGKLPNTGLDPVDPVTGAFLWSHTLLESYGKEALHFTMMYNSQEEVPVEIMGKKWTHAFHYYLYMRDEKAYFGTPYGEFISFIREGAEDSFQPVQGAPSGYSLNRKEDGTWQVSETDGTEYLFDENLALSKIMEGGFAAYQFHADEEGRIILIEGKHGGILTFTYENDRISSASDASGNTIHFTYEEGRLAAATDPEENSISFAYDSHDWLRAITDASGSAYLANRYDASGRVVSQSIAGRGESAASYDTENRCTAFTDELGNETKYYYDENRRITKVEQAGTCIRNSWNEKGQLAQQTDALGNTTQMLYDKKGRMNCVIYPDGTREQTTYNEAGYPASITDREGRESFYAYDERNNLTCAQNERGDACTYAYDDRDNLISYTDREGNLWQYAYDENNYLKQTHDPEGNICRYSHDMAGRLTSYTSPQGRTTSYEYSDAGSLLCITDAEGTIRYTYDSNGNPAGITDKRGNSASFVYNEMGQPILSTGFMGEEYRYAYDEKGRLVKETDPLGFSISYVYDALGRCISLTDKNGGTTSYAYDGAGRLAEVRDGAGGTVSYTYDTMGQVKTVTDPLNNQTGYAYDQAGRITEVTDPLGHSVSYTYDPAGNLLTKTDEDGAVTFYAYDKENRLLSIRNEAGTTSFAYDRLGRLVCVLDSEGNREEGAYDGDGILTSLTDKEGRQTTYVYDNSGRLSEKTAPDGGRTAYAYDQNGNCTKITDAEGNEYAYAYDADNRLTKVTDPLKRETLYAYDARGQLISITDARGGKTEFAYDGNGNLTKETNPLGGVKTYEYDSAGRLTKRTDEEGNQSSYAYDAAGNLTAYTDAAGNTWTFAYDARGQLTSAGDQNEDALTYEYTPAGRLSKVTDKEGAQTSYAYDGAGRLTGLSDALGNSESFTYDSLGRMLARTDALGNTTEYEYSPSGNLLRVKEPEGGTASYTYDSLGRMLTKTDALGNTTSYAYDLSGRVTALTDPEGGVTSFTYTPSGQIASAVNAEGGTTLYEYDACGNLIRTTDPAGAVREYEYDAMNNQLKECLKVSGEQACATLYQYDKKGQRIKEISPLKEEKAYAYDGNGNLISILDEDQNQTTIRYDLNSQSVFMGYSDGREAAFRYNKRGELVEIRDWTGTALMERDLLGRLTKVTDPEGRTTGYAYDAAGNLSQTIYPDKSAASYAYDRNRRLTQVTDAEGKAARYAYDAAGRITALTQPGSRSSYTYNAAGLPIRAGYRLEDGTILEEQLAYDAMGRITSAERTGSSPALTTAAAYTYDPAGRLLSCTQRGIRESYTYDAAGNRTARKVNGILKTACTYNEASQLTALTENGKEYTYRYDRRGNLTEEQKAGIPIRRYAYDAANHMVSGKNLENGEKTSYTYNALGMRTNLIQTLLGKDAFKTREVSYLPDYLSGTANDLVAYEQGFGITRTIYGNGYTRLSQKVTAFEADTGENGGGAGTDAGTENTAGAGTAILQGMLPIRTGTGAIPPETLIGTEVIGKTYFQPDIYGSPLFASNEQGQVLSYAERNIWGSLRLPVHNDLNISGIEDSLRFTSYAYDPVIGKYFAQARFYDSRQGRMLSKDPIKRDINGYPYCNNDPVNCVDPTGEIANVLIGGAIGGLVGGAFGFANSAVSQLMSGKGFDSGKAWGAAANGAIVGAVKGAVAGSGVGLPLAIAADFTAGTLGSVAEQAISEGVVDAGKSIAGGLTNAVNGLIYGNGALRSLREAAVKGAASGALTSGINYLADVTSPQPAARRSPGIQYQGGAAGMFRPRDPKRGCVPSDPSIGSLRYGRDYGYQYNVPVSGEESQNRRGFSLWNFGKEVVLGAVTGGMAGATFYGAGRAVRALKESIKGGSYKDLYRAVSPEEYDDVFKTGGFRATPDGRTLEAKEFGNSLEDTLKFANHPINVDKAAILEVTIPKSMYNQLNHMNLDTPYFKSGTTIVEPDLLDAFNKSISNIKHVY